VNWFQERHYTESCNSDAGEKPSGTDWKISCCDFSFFCKNASRKLCQVHNRCTYKFAHPLRHRGTFIFCIMQTLNRLLKLRWYKNGIFFAFSIPIFTFLGNKKMPTLCKEFFFSSKNLKHVLPKKKIYANIGDLFGLCTTSG